jgi:hypothetical protein
MGLISIRQGRRKNMNEKKPLKKLSAIISYANNVAILECMDLVTKPNLFARQFYRVTFKCKYSNYH